MIQFSDVITPTTMKAGTHFEALQYSRDAFEGLSDPVLQIDAFSMQGPTFAAHPHAGFSAVTYLLDDSQGSFINQDSLGNKLELLPGSTHWTRASNGIVHEETPKTNGVEVKGLQIFMNLPEQDQSEAPGAFHVSPSAVDISNPKQGVTIKTSVSGTNIGGQKALTTPAYIVEFELSKMAQYEMNINANTGGLFIVIAGTVKIGEETLSTNQAIAFNSLEQSTIEFVSFQEMAKFVFVGGERLNQAIHQKGPFILASTQALAARIAAFERGEFGQIETSQTQGDAQ
jgi:redox-sensitive bicupin YhaK (pirin superfamily)